MNENSVVCARELGKTGGYTPNQQANCKSNEILAPHTAHHKLLKKSMSMTADEFKES